MSATDYLAWGLVAHVVGDWLLQNDWLARNKVHVTHPAAAVHSGIHAFLLVLVFPWPVAVALGLAHLAIDTRKPRLWWSRLIGQTMEGDVALHVAFWVDQAMHLATIAAAALLMARSGL
jgi:hypothetical protein